MSALQFFSHISRLVIEDLDPRDAVCLLGTCRSVRANIPQPTSLYIAAAHFADSWRCFYKDRCTIGQWVEVGLACADLRYDESPRSDRRSESQVTPDVWFRAELRYDRMPLDTSSSYSLRLTCENKFASVAIRFANWLASRQSARTVTISAILALDWEIAQGKMEWERVELPWERAEPLERRSYWVGNVRSNWNAVVLLSDARFAMISANIAWIGKSPGLTRIREQPSAWGFCVTANSLSHLNEPFSRLRVYRSGAVEIRCTRDCPVRAYRSGAFEIVPRADCLEDIVGCPEDLLREFLEPIGSTFSCATLFVDEDLWACAGTFSDAYARFSNPSWDSWTHMTRIARRQAAQSGMASHVRQDASEYARAHLDAYLTAGHISHAHDPHT